MQLAGCIRGVDLFDQERLAGRGVKQEVGDPCELRAAADILEHAAQVAADKANDKELDAEDCGP